MEDAVRLLPPTLQTFQEACDLLAREEATSALRNFYLHVRVCSFILLHLYEESPEKFVASLASNPVPGRLLGSLDQVVDRHEIQPFLGLTVPDADTNQDNQFSFLPGLRVLQRFWSQESTHPEARKLSFARKCLDFGSRQRQDALITHLKQAEEACREYSRVDPSDLALENDLRSRQKRVPPLDIWPLAQSVYSALDSSKTDRCGVCNVPHLYNARLCIETYRDRNYVRECDFDMFLGLDQLWHEARIRSITKSTVRFGFDDNDSGDNNPHGETKQRRRNRGGLKTGNGCGIKVKNLCRQFKDSQTRWMYRLNFEVRDNELWKIASEQSSFIVDTSEQAISLAQFIAERPHVLNGKTKRILAVLLGYAVVHLYGTGWSQPSWGSENILFFKTGGAIPLKPYLELQPRLEGSDLHQASDTAREEDEDDPDDDLFYHPYPCLVSLALMLIELHQARPIESIAKEHRLTMSPNMSNEDRFLVAGQIFKSCKQDFEDQTRMAIDSCLDVTIGSETDDGKPDENTLRNAIYENIVRRLEDELEQGYRDISVDGLDSLTQTLDLARFGRRIKPEASEEPTHPKVVEPKRGTLRKRLADDESSSERRLVHDRALASNSREARRDGASSPRLRFFDNETGGLSTTKQEAYASWKECVRDVYDKFLPEKDRNTRVKIAVLDTGIDRGHLDFHACDERIKECRSYVGKDQSQVHDSSGHGTHVASLLLDYAPEADIYIAKITAANSVSSSVVASAIDDAVKNWQPDIISMSFGWPARDDEYEDLEKALRNARAQDILIFAAASNDGANAKRAWPARHAGGDNFAVVGEAVEGAWPRHLCDPTVNKNSLAHKSGTSFATPIAAGIAAFLLQYARDNLPAKHAKRLKQFEGMTTVLREISVENQRYHYIAPRLHPDNFFGRGEEFVKTNLKEALS